MTKSRKSRPRRTLPPHNSPALSSPISTIASAIGSRKPWVLHQMGPIPPKFGAPRTAPSPITDCVESPSFARAAPGHCHSERSAPVFAFRVRALCEHAGARSRGISLRFTSRHRFHPKWGATRAAHRVSSHFAAWIPASDLAMKNNAGNETTKNNPPPRECGCSLRFLIVS